MQETSIATDETAEESAGSAVENMAGSAGQGAESSAGGQVPARSEPSPRGSGRVAVAVVLLALAVLVAGWQWKQAHHANELESTREQALQAAQRNAVVMSSYDHRDFDAYTEAVMDLATGEFADRFAAREKDLRTVVEQSEAQVEATVVDAAVHSASDDDAVVLLFVDQTLRGAKTDDESTSRMRMRMTLVRSGDRWLVSKLGLL